MAATTLLTVPIESGARLCPDAVAILLPSGQSDQTKIAWTSSSSSGDGDYHNRQLTIATVATQQDLLSRLPDGCARAFVLTPTELESGVCHDAALRDALAARNIEVTNQEFKVSQLRGLANCWLPACASSESHQQQPLPQAWHENPPPCDQVVTHSASWRLINERLSRRMRRHEATSPSGSGASATAVVAELGPRALTIYKIDSGSDTVSSLVHEAFLGYENLLGLAALSTVPCCSASLPDLLASAAKGSMAKLDLTIGDLLPPNSVYGNYDPATVVFTLGKLHDFKTIEDLQPSPHDVAASLAYAFTKIFFDTIVHATSAYGIPKVAIAGEFFQSECCRKRLFETWNFDGIPKDALNVHFLRQDWSESLALAGSLLVR